MSIPLIQSERLSLKVFRQFEFLTSHSTVKPHLHKAINAIYSTLPKTFTYFIYLKGESDVWLTVHRNSVWIRKTN